MLFWPLPVKGLHEPLFHTEPNSLIRQRTGLAILLWDTPSMLFFGRSPSGWQDAHKHAYNDLIQRLWAIKRLRFHSFFHGEQNKWLKN